MPPGRTVFICALLILAAPVRVSAVSWEDLITATEAHREMIRSGRGSYRYIGISKDPDASYNKYYEGKWALRDDRVRLVFRANQEGRFFDNGIKGKSEGEYEWNPSAVLFFTSSRQMALASAPMKDKTWRGVYFYGIEAVDYFHSTIRDHVECMREGLYHSEILTDEDSNLLRIRSWREGPNSGKGEILIDPAKQYSVIRYRWERTTGSPWLAEAHAEMEYIAAAGIWFPSRAEARILEGNPLECVKSKSIEFSDTELNIPIPDSALTTTLPPGTMLTDGFARDGYKTRVPLTLSQIVSSKGWELHKTQRADNQRAAAAAASARERAINPTLAKQSRIPTLLVTGGVFLIIVALLAVIKRSWGG